DQDGVHIGGQSNPAQKQINAALAQALAKSGLTITLVSNETSINGATGSVTAGALLIQYEDDKNQLVPGAVHNSFVVALGGATAEVDSSQGSNTDLGETPTEVAGLDSGGGEASVAGPEIPPAGLGEIAIPPTALASTPR